MSDTTKDMKPLLAKVATGKPLTESEAETAFDIIMSGEATQAQIGAFLMGLRVRGETVDEIAGAVRIMRAKMQGVNAPKGAIDVVGTGGDASGTYNVSTASAFVVAAAGVTVAKHGNRALSSKSGAADVLKALGVNIDAKIDVVEKCITAAGIGFLMAPLYHSAMRHVGGPRVELGTRTVFNILGPLANPASVTRQFTGAFAREWIEPMARVLGKVGCERAWVVHGSDGLDEMTTTGPSYVADLENGSVKTFEVTPEDAGLKRGTLADLKGGDPDFNAKAMRDVFDGKPGAYRDIVLLNSAAAFIVAGKARTLKEGAALAAATIDQGKAKATLAKLVAVSNP